MCVEYSEAFYTAVDRALASVHECLAVLNANDEKIRRWYFERYGESLVSKDSHEDVKHESI